MAGNNENEIFGNASLFEDFMDTAVSKPQLESNIYSHDETFNQMKEKIDQLKQENQELRRQMRLLIHPGGPEASSSEHNSPMVQVLFFDHDCVCFHRHQIEDFFEHITSLTNGDSEGLGVSDDVRPKPQRSSRPLQKDLMGSSSEESFTVTGNVQYYQRFCIDSLGRPLVDGNPQLTAGWNIPCYSGIFHEALPIDETEKPNQARPKRSKPTCWNCNKEEHSIRDCPFPRDLVKISMAKKEFMEQSAANVSLNKRYHKDVEEGGSQQFAKFTPGQISGDLREALGLNEQQIPPYIYQMRLLGYPPGYLKHTEVLKSGLTVYDMEEGEEPGQITNDQADSKVTYDPSKLIDYPGFNVALPEGVRDPHGVPPMRIADSRDVFQTFMTPSQGSKNGKKRGCRNFSEDPDKKRPRVEREEVDMDVEGYTPDARFSKPSQGTADFKPPLPPTPVPETPPPLPTSTPPVTPGNTPRLMQAEMPSEFPAVKCTGEASTDADFENASLSSASRGATPGSMSPSMDDLQSMQSRIREALMHAAEEGSSALSDVDNASDRFVVDGEEFIVDSVSGDEGEDNANKTVEMDKEVCEVAVSQDEDAQSSEEVGYEPQTLEAEDKPITGKEESEPRTVQDNEQSGELTEGATSVQTPDHNMEKKEAAGDEADLEPGEIPSSDLDATPNRSGVPHISKFAVGISPHENENLSESTGMLKRILNIFSRSKGKPPS